MAVLKQKRKYTTLLSLLALAITSTGSAAAQPREEYAVKAAYLVHLLSYVEWPPASSSEKTICVLGRDPFGHGLERTVAEYGKSGSGAIGVRRLGEGQSARGCRLLFVAHGAPRRLRSVLDSALDTGILTVGEAQGGSSPGTVIALETSEQDHRVRIAIDVDAAAQHGFRVSSRLLKMARLLKEGGAPL